MIPANVGWHNWFMHGAAPWITSPPLILKVVALVYLPHLPFSAIGPLGLHDDGCTLELQLQTHWLALEMLVWDGPGADNISQWNFGMWLVALPSWWDHVVPLPVMTGLLTRLLKFCDGLRGLFCSRWPPHNLVLSWRGICCKYLQVWKSFLLILVSPILVYLNFL